MLFGLNQGPKALQFAKQYLDSNPNRAGAHFIYASALANSKRYDEAIPEYQKAIQMEPKGLLSYMQLASVYQYKGKWTMPLRPTRRHWRWYLTMQPFRARWATLTCRRVI